MPSKKQKVVARSQAGNCLARVDSLCIHTTVKQYDKRCELTDWIACKREKCVDYSSNYWSASPNANNSNNAWNVNFNNGNSNNNNKSNNKYVRLVRSGA